MSRDSGGPDTPKRNRNNVPGLLRAMPVNVSVKDGKVSISDLWYRDDKDRTASFISNFL